jgi:hypothetical protein
MARPCGEQAGRNASERRAGVETSDVGADPATRRGRPRPLVSREMGGIGRPASDPTRRATGVMTRACLDTEIHRNTGSPGSESAPLPDAHQGQAGLPGVAERLVVPSKPGSSGRAKPPQFTVNATSGRQPIDRREPATCTESWENVWKLYVGRDSSGSQCDRLFALPGFQSNKMRNRGVRIENSLFDNAVDRRSRR